MTREPVTVTLDYKPPLDWGFILGYLGGRLTAGVEVVDRERYSRAVEIGGDTGTVSVSHDPHAGRVAVSIHGDARRHAAAIGGRVRRMLDLALDPAAVRSALGTDPWIGPLLAARPGIRVPGAWSPFELLVRTIVGQQVSVRAGTTIMGRIAGRLGRPAAGPDGVTPLLLFPTPAAVAEGNLDAIGMPAQRVGALKTVARAVADGVISFPDPGDHGGGVKEALLGLPGIGPWTVEYFALRALGDADAWPGTDLVLRRAIEQPARGGAPRSVSDRWRPYRAYAAMLLWAHAAANPPARRTPKKRSHAED